MESSTKCDSCQTQILNKKTQKKCLACTNGVNYCSEECQKKHWKKHKRSCNLSKVCVVEFDQIQERDYALQDFSAKAGWQKCKVTSHLGVPLIVKKIESKNKIRTNKIGRVLMVEPDETLIANELFECVDNGEVLIKSKDETFVPYKQSTKAFRSSNNKQGIMMFAREDRRDLTSEMLTDLFNYVYKLTEFYSSGLDSIHEAKQMKEMCTSAIFNKFQDQMTHNTRKEIAKFNIRNYPPANSRSRNDSRSSSSSYGGYYDDDDGEDLADTLGMFLFAKMLFGNRF